MYTKVSRDQKESINGDAKKIVDKYSADFDNLGIKIKYCNKTVKFTNKYKLLLIVLNFSCTLKNQKREKEYAFYFMKIPVSTKKEYILTNSKVLKNIEKLLRKKLKRAQAKGALSVCNTSLVDFLKCLTFKYSYKEKFGKIDLSIIKFTIVAIIILLIVVLKFIDSYKFFLENGYYHPFLFR